MLHALASPWIPTVVLFATAMVLRIMQGSTVAPSVFPAFLWTAYLALPLLITPMPVAGIAAWVIVAVVMAAVVGALLGQGRGSLGQDADEASEPTLLVGRMVRIAVVLAAVALTGVLYYGITSMARFSLPWTTDGLLRLSIILYGLTYEVNEPSLVRLLITWAYPAAVLGGVAFSLSTRRWPRALALLPFLPAIAYGMLLTARTTIMVSTCCWLSGFLAAKAYRHHGLFQFGRRRMIVVVLLGALLVGAFIGLDMLRGLDYSESARATTRLQGSVFGYLAVFSNWVTHDNYEELGLGAFTVAGVFDILKIKTRLHGLYADALSFESGDDSNIYSAFRGLIQDFTLPGALLVSGLWGFLAGYAYRRAAAGGLRWAVLVGAYYAFFFWSPIVSLFNYNGVILAFVVTFMVLSNTKTTQRPAQTTAVVAGS